MIEARLQKEIVLHSEDRVGIFADVTRILSDMGINLLAVRLATSEDAVDIHLLTSSQSYAREALQDAGFELSERDVIVLELPHHPGFLRRASEAMARRNLSIDDLHVSIQEDAKVGVVVLSCTNNAHAIQILRGY